MDKQLSDEKIFEIFMNKESDCESEESNDSEDEHWNKWVNESEDLAVELIDRECSVSRPSLVDNSNSLLVTPGPSSVTDVNLGLPNLSQNRPKPVLHRPKSVRPTTFTKDNPKLFECGDSDVESTDRNCNISNKSFFVTPGPSSKTDVTLGLPNLLPTRPKPALHKPKSVRPNTSTSNNAKRIRLDLRLPTPTTNEESEYYGPQNIFEWRAKRNFENDDFIFDETQSGINFENVELDDDCCESDCFKVLFDECLVEHISHETNRYCEQVKNKLGPELKPNSKIHKWYDTTVGEIYTFFAVILLMGHVRKNKLTEYWSTDPLLSTPIFADIFSLDRFLLILRFLHFSNNDSQIRGDRLHKIMVVICSLKKKFSDIFVPFTKLCIDESVVQWKGRLSFKQYLPKKRHRFGVKCFVMCDCKTGFVLDIIIYTGKQTYIDVFPELGISGSVVATMLEPYLDMGHILYVDNWYTSPQLFQYLYDHKTGAVGTARADRKMMPKFPSKMKTGDYLHKETPCLLAEKWVDKRELIMLSTTHKPKLVDSGKKDHKSREPIMKPESVVDYNVNMGLVDKSDMQISFNDSARKSSKWYKKLFFHFLDITVLNACILYQMKTKKTMKLGQFRLNLIRQLLHEFTPERRVSSGGRRSKVPAPLRLTARHFPDLIPSTEKKGKPRRACHVCRWTTVGEQRRRDTTWWCPDCDVALCVPECFRIYHTKTNF